MVFTFVLSVGGLFKLTELVARGVPMLPLLKIFISSMPQALGLAIPVSAITATLLVFGRLSADSEITAMKAGGISLWKVASWMLPSALLLLLACIYINSDLAPRSHYARRASVTQIGEVNPVDMIEEGRTIRDFDGISLYVGRRKNRVLEDVRIFDQREEGRTRLIKADRGVVTMSEGGDDMVLTLEQVTIDPFSFERPGSAYSGRWTLRITDVRRKAYYRKRDKDLTLLELYEGMGALRREAVENAHSMEGPMRVGVAELRERMMKLRVEFHKRLALAGSAFAFVFLGMPLGIRSHRKESSLGIGISLAVVFIFYMFIIVADQLSGRPEWRPDLLNWVPVVLALLLGGGMLRRLD